MSKTGFEKDINFRTLLLFFLRRVWILLLAALVCGGAYLLVADLGSEGMNTVSSTRQLIVAVSHAQDEVIITRSEQQNTLMVSLFYKLKDPLFLQEAQTKGLLPEGLDLKEVSLQTEYPKMVDSSFLLTVSSSTDWQSAAVADTVVAQAQKYLDTWDWYADAEVQTLNSVDGISTSSSRLKYAAVLGFAGFLVAAFVLFVYFVTRKKLDEGEEIEFYTGLPCLGIVGQSAGQAEVRYAAARAIKSLGEGVTLAILSCGGNGAQILVGGLAKGFCDSGVAVCNCLIEKGEQVKISKRDEQGSTVLEIPSLVGTDALLPGEIVSSHRAVLYSSSDFCDEASLYWLSKICDRSILAVERGTLNARQLREWIKALDLEDEKVVGVLLYKG
jgi:capsular polysaccharide biosynthesis protein